MRVRGDAAARQQRELDKRYGPVKELFRRRAEEAGAVLLVDTPSMREITDLQRLDRHFRTYLGTVHELAIRNARTLVGLYNARVNGRMREVHVVWMFGDAGNVIGRNRDFFEEIGSIRDDDETAFRKVPSRIFEKLYREPGLLALANEALVLAYADALEFHRWKVMPKGMVVTGTGLMAAVQMNHVAEFGNDALGIEVGTGMIEAILGGKGLGVEELRRRMAPILVHEMVHLQDRGNGEAHAHAIEAIMLWQEGQDGRDVFRDRIAGFEKVAAADGTFGKDYDSQAYLGILLAMEELAKCNADIAAAFAKDASMYKTLAVSASLDMVRREDMVKAKERGFVERVLGMSILERTNAAALRVALGEDAVRTIPLRGLVRDEAPKAGGISAAPHG